MDGRREAEAGRLDAARSTFALFLVAEIVRDGVLTYELIDGLQRLNAVFSFLENEYAVEGEYFDLDSLADTKLALHR